MAVVNLYSWCGSGGRWQLLDSLKWHPKPDDNVIIEPNVASLMHVHAGGVATLEKVSMVKKKTKNGSFWSNWTPCEASITYAKNQQRPSQSSEGWPKRGATGLEKLACFLRDCLFYQWT